jgi:hypothetical protein
MTKRDGFSLEARGDHIANLHLTAGDDDVIDEQFHQLSALGKGQLVQGGLQPPAKGLEPLGQGGDIHLLLRLSLELAQLLGQAVLGVRHLLSFAFELITPDDLGQVDLQQPGLLPFELREGFMQGLPSGLQGLGQPFAAMGTRQFMGDERGFGQDLAEILPDQRVQGPSRGKACGTALAPGRPQGIGPAATAIIGIAWGNRTPHTGQLALATTDQAPEQVLVGGVIPAGHLGVPSQPVLRCREGLLADNSRHGDGDPFVGRGRPMTKPRTHWAQSGLAYAGEHRSGALAVGGACVDW